MRKPRPRKAAQSSASQRAPEELLETRRDRLKQRLANHIPLKLKVSRDRMGNINFILPNLTTVMALCMGLSAVRFALLERWEFAIAAILLAGVLDGMDGRIARMLNSTSRFGAELDSLSDFISFGVSPALIIYFRSLHQWQGYGWMFVLYFTICMALRLARFNTMSIEGTSPAWSSNFFVGTPAPATAILALTPTMLAIDFDQGIWSSPLMNAFTLFFIGSLAISTIPTYSFKKINISNKYVIPIMISGTMILGILFVEPWLTLSAVAIGYLCLLPFSIRSFNKMKKYGAE